MKKLSREEMKNVMGGEVTSETIGNEETSKCCKEGVDCSSCYANSVLECASGYSKVSCC